MEKNFYGITIDATKDEKKISLRFGISEERFVELASKSAEISTTLVLDGEFRKSELILSVLEQGQNLQEVAFLLYQAGAQAARMEFMGAAMARR